MPVNINADTVVGGAVVTADASGVLALQAAGSTQVTVNTSGVTLANALPAGSGGTGRTTLTANNVLLGNGTSAVNFVAPGTSGNVLTSNGTTWASSSLAIGPVGAVGVGSMIIDTTNNLYGATAADQLSASGWSSLPPYRSSGSSFVVPRTPKYSTFYGGWIATLSYTDTAGNTTNQICVSKNGGGWSPICPLPVASGISYGDVMDDGSVGVTVDDSNGRIFLAWVDNTNYLAGYAYQNTAANPASGFTNVTLNNGSAYSQTPQVASIEYVNFGSAANSGIVVSSKAYGSGTQINVIPAGSTSQTNRYSSSYPINNNYGGRLVWDPTFGRAMFVNRFTSAAPYTTVVYSPSGNVNAAWSAFNATNTTFTSNSRYGSLSAMSPQYAVYPLNNGNLYYSADFTTWTATNLDSAVGGTVYLLGHNGTNWIAVSSTGVWYSSSATPTGFTRASFTIPTNSYSYPLGIRKV